MNRMLNEAVEDDVLSVCYLCPDSFILASYWSFFEANFKQ